MCIGQAEHQLHGHFTGQQQPLAELLGAKGDAAGEGPQQQGVGAQGPVQALVQAVKLVDRPSQQLHPPRTPAVPADHRVLTLLVSLGHDVHVGVS